MKTTWKYRLADIEIAQPERDAVARVLASKWLSCGPVTGKFEEEISSFLGVDRSVALSSGTAALHLAMRCMDVKAGDEVIVPSLTFVATANAILHAGGTPVFADIAAGSAPLVSPEDIEAKITPRTRGIVVVHYGGYPCDMKRITGLAAARGLFVVEDAAHAIGGKIGDRMLGTLGDVGCFSFFANKNLASGEGGLLVARSPEVAERARRLRSHGMTSPTWDREQGHAFTYDVTEVGFNYRMTEIQAALGRAQLSRLAAGNERRRELVERYRANLKEHPLLSVPFAGVGGTLAYHLFPVLLDATVDRIGFMTALRNDGIQSSIHYPPVHQFSCFLRDGRKTCALPVTEDVAARIVTLPLHPLMRQADVDRICMTVARTLAPRPAGAPPSGTVAAPPPEDATEGDAA